MPHETFSGRAASQDPHELREFVALLHAEKVARYCEIGARHGDTFHDVMMSLPARSIGVACDLPGGAWGTDSSRKALERAVKDLVRRGYRASCVFGDSSTPATMRIVASRGPYDAILIDGDHRYAGVKADWEVYGGMAPLIAFHDIAGAGCADKHSGLPVEVPKLWAEITKSGRRCVEFISPGSRMGIGVVWPR